MAGYPDAASGFPSNMQPALAYAVDAGTNGASLGWTRYMSRSPNPFNPSNRSGYTNYAQFSIVPYSIPQTTIANGLMINGFNVPITGVFGSESIFVNTGSTSSGTGSTGTGSTGTTSGTGNIG